MASSSGLDEELNDDVLFLDVFQEHLFLAERQRSGNQRGGLRRGKKGNGGGGGAEDAGDEEEGFVTLEVFFLQR
ncbi:hypothetical protein LINGRAHAP2_LOCUS10502 [Linum grandiflorum]